MDKEKLEGIGWDIRQRDESSEKNKQEYWIGWWKEKWK